MYSGTVEHIQIKWGQALFGWSKQPHLSFERGLIYLHMDGGSWGGVYLSPPSFVKIEGTARQRRCAALLLAHPDFQTLRHRWYILFTKIM